MDGLTDFIREAMAKGEDREAIREALHKGGWLDHQITRAMGGYETMAFGIPLPSARSRQRPNAWFFNETSHFAVQVFQVIEWLAVMVGVRYAAVRTESTMLNFLFVALWLLLVIHVVASWVKFEWWLWPGLDRGTVKGLRKCLYVSLTLGASYIFHLLIMNVSNALLLAQPMA